MSGVEIQFMFHRSNGKIDPERAPPPCRNFSRVASLAFHFHLICHKPLYMRPNFDHCLALSVRQSVTAFFEFCCLVGLVSPVSLVYLLGMVSLLGLVGLVGMGCQVGLILGTF